MLIFILFLFLYGPLSSMCIVVTHHKCTKHQGTIKQRLFDDRIIFK